MAEDKVICPVYKRGAEATTYFGAVLCQRNPCPYGHELGKEIDPDQESSVCGAPELRVCTAEGMLEKRVAEKFNIMYNSVG